MVAMCGGLVRPIFIMEESFEFEGKARVACYKHVNLFIYFNKILKSYVKTHFKRLSLYAYNSWN